MMAVITAEELRRVADSAERGEDLARRRSPQPSVLAEYFRERNRQMAAVREMLAKRKDAAA